MVAFTLQAFVDGVLVGEGEGESEPFSTATCFLGDTTGVDDQQASDYYWDDVAILREADGAAMLGNGGFEVALLSQVGNPPVSAAIGNWRPHLQPSFGTTVARVSSPVKSGAWAMRTAAPAGRSAPYVMQDVLLQSGDTFDFDFDVWPVLGGQLAAITFDWDRGFTGAAAGSVTANMTAAAFSATLSGSALQDPNGNPLPSFTADPLPYGAWSHVLLRVRTSRTGWHVGPAAVRMG